MTHATRTQRTLHMGEEVRVPKWLPGDYMRSTKKYHIKKNMSVLLRLIFYLNCWLKWPSTIHFLGARYSDLFNRQIPHEYRNSIASCPQFR